MTLSIDHVNDKYMLSCDNPNPQQPCLTTVIDVPRNTRLVKTGRKHMAVIYPPYTRRPRVCSMPELIKIAEKGFCPYIRTVTTIC